MAGASPDITGLAITGLGILSPLGIGWEAFRTAIIQGDRCHPAEWPSSDGPVVLKVCAIQEHDPTVWLGKKGLKYLDRAAVLVLSAVHLGLTAANYEITERCERETAAVLGTSMGSIEGITEAGRDTFIQALPYQISSMRAPLSVMNGMAGYIGIWYKARGVNATICAGRLSGLAALRYAVVTLRAGRCRAALVGAVESLSTPFAWITRHAEQQLGVVDLLTDSFVVGEGCGMLVLENLDVAREAGRKPVVELLDCRTAFADTRDPTRIIERQSEALAALIDDVLERHVPPEEIHVVSIGSHSTRYREAVTARAVDLAIGSSAYRHTIRTADRSGDCYSASGVLELAAVAAALTSEHMPPSACGLVTSADPHGGIGCALVKRSLA